MMSFLRKWLSMNRGKPEPNFEDFEVKTGYTAAGHVPYASIEEFFALSSMGDTHAEAVQKLRLEFDERIRYMKQNCEQIPLPGSGRARARFAGNDQIESLRPFIDEFWEEILGTSYSTSFVSNESVLSSWDHYLSGGRSALIQRVKEKYRVNISAYYDEPIPVVLQRIKDANA